MINLHFNREKEEEFKLNKYPSRKTKYSPSLEDSGMGKYSLNKCRINHAI